MQSCEVRQWQTFLQLRKKYVYIIYIYHLAIFGRSNSFPPEKTSTLLSIMKILLEARFESSFCFAETHIFHQFSSYFLFDGQQEIKSRALCTNSIQWITEVGWICQDSVRLRLEPEDSFQLFQDTAHGKTKKRRILLNTIGWNYRKMGYFTKEYGSFLHIPLSKQTEQILAGPLVTPVLSPDPSVVDTFLSASTHDPSKKKCLLFLREYESGFQMDGSSSCTYHGKTIWKSCCWGLYPIERSRERCSDDLLCDFSGIAHGMPTAAVSKAGTWIKTARFHCPIH